MTQEQVQEKYAQSEFAKHFEFRNEQELRDAERAFRGYYVAHFDSELSKIFVSVNEIERLFYTIRKLWAAKEQS